MTAWIAGGCIILHQEGALMSLFTDEEIAFLHGQRLGRLATANTHGELHVTPVGFAYNAELDTIDIGGRRGGCCGGREHLGPRATRPPCVVVGARMPAAAG